MNRYTSDRDIYILLLHIRILTLDLQFKFFIIHFLRKMVLIKKRNTSN